jgi:hypothetical protein
MESPGIAQCVPSEMGEGSDVRLKPAFKGYKEGSFGVFGVRFYV